MRSAQKRQKVLYGVAAFLVIWAWYVVLHDPIYRGALLRLTGGSPPPATALPDAGIYEAHDPPIGAPFPNTGIAAEIRKKTPPNKRGYLLAAIGDCSTCTRLDLAKLYTQAKKRGILLLAFSTGDASHVRQYAANYRREGIDIPLYRDNDVKLAEAINSYYPGRLYYYTSEWKLRWRERDMHIDNYLFVTGRFDRVMRNTEPEP